MFLKYRFRDSKYDVIIFKNKINIFKIFSNNCKLDYYKILYLLIKIHNIKQVDKFNLNNYVKQFPSRLDFNKTNCFFKLESFRSILIFHFFHIVRAYVKIKRFLYNINYLNINNYNIFYISKKFISFPYKINKFTIIKGPHVHKKSREQFEKRIISRVINFPYLYINEYFKFFFFITKQQHINVGLGLRIMYNSLYYKYLKLYLH